MNEAQREFARIARTAVDDLLAADPVEATWLGDHRFDDRLPDYSVAGRSALAQRVDDHLTSLDAVDDVELPLDELVDLEILRAALTKAQFEAVDLRANEWNPLLWNPGTGLHLLLSREFAPLPDRLASAQARLAGIPRFLADARQTLGEMPGVHVETAIAQLHGTVGLIEHELAPQLAMHDPAASNDIANALDALRGFIDWLGARQPESRRSPRIGERLYSAVLWHALDDGTTAAELLDRAETHFALVETQLREVAAQYLGEPENADDLVRRALDRVAAEAPVTDATVLALVAEAVDSTRSFTIAHDLMDVPQIDVQVIEMPEIHRGVAVAYCDSPGPLEVPGMPTFVAVSPTPEGWSAERVASFYREYNGVQLHDLTIHEAFPGHVLQLAHAQRVAGRSLVRSFGMSGAFVEGWAVYTEELMLDRGYAPSSDPRSALAVRMQQLKMQARMTINAILDVRVHAGDMEEADALTLMTQRGFQEEGEAVGKWRRALLTAGQLPTYFVGYQAVRSIAHDLRVVHPDWSDRQVHDVMLSVGSPAPRHLRTLIGL